MKNPRNKMTLRQDFSDLWWGALITAPLLNGAGAALFGISFPDDESIMIKRLVTAGIMIATGTVLFLVAKSHIFVKDVKHGTTLSRQEISQK